MYLNLSPRVSRHLPGSHVRTQALSVAAVPEPHALHLRPAAGAVRASSGSAGIRLGHQQVGATRRRRCGGDRRNIREAKNFFASLLIRPCITFDSLLGRHTRSLIYSIALSAPFPSAAAASTSGAWSWAKAWPPECACNFLPPGPAALRLVSVCVGGRVLVLESV